MPMNQRPTRPIPIRYPADLRQMCLRDGPCGVKGRRRSEDCGSRAAGSGPLGLWLRRLAFARLRARSLYRATGIFDGTDLP